MLRRALNLRLALVDPKNEESYSRLNWVGTLSSSRLALGKVIITKDQVEHLPAEVLKEAWRYGHWAGPQ